MKNKELKTLTKKERSSKLLELRQELMKINGQRAVGTVPKSPGQVRKIKKTIARIMFMEHTLTKEKTPSKA